MKQTPDDEMRRAASTPNGAILKPEEGLEGQEPKRPASSGARSLAGILKRMMKTGDFVNHPNVRDAIGFLKACINEHGAEIEKLEKRQQVQARAFKGKAVPSLWGDTETIESLKEEMQFYEEIITRLGIINDQDRKLEDVVKEWEVPIDELFDVIDDVREKMRSQAGGRALGWGKTILNWRMGKYDQVARILGGHADELNASGLSTNKIEELIERNKNELEKAGLTKIAGEIVEALRKRLS